PRVGTSSGSAAAAAADDAMGSGRLLWVLGAVALIELLLERWTKFVGRYAGRGVRFTGWPSFALLPPPAGVLLGDLGEIGWMRTERSGKRR
ncbi:hypothetical protein THAOC_14006, partial [Thalassiosira oceanica]